MFIQVKKDVLMNPDLAKNQKLVMEVLEAAGGEQESFLTYSQEIETTMLVHSIVYSLLLVLSLTLLVATCLTDPGIIPRSSEEVLQFL